jgi:tRNA U34 5-methylaminomethyl-2-thiouridine-forming methyltransferase MnmC
MVPRLRLMRLMKLVDASWGKFKPYYPSVQLKNFNILNLFKYPMSYLVCASIAFQVN